MDSVNVRNPSWSRFFTGIYGEFNRAKFISKKSKSQIALAKEKILIIDSEWNILKLLYGILSSNYDLTIKNSPVSAVQWMQNGNLPSLIICEYQLQHFNGALFIQQIRHSGLHYAIPIIVLSDAEDLEQKIDSLSCKVNGILKKPFNPVLLESTIKEVLNECRI